MIKLFLIAFLVFFNNVWAANNWNGNWQGEGKITDDNGDTLICDYMQIIINHKKQPKWEGIWVISGLPQCGMPSELGASFMLEISKGDILHAGILVGKMGEDYLSIVQYADKFKETIDLMQTSEGDLIYRKLITFKNSMQNYMIEGKLAR